MKKCLISIVKYELGKVRIQNTGISLTGASTNIGMIL